MKKNTIFLLHKGIHIDKEIDDATKYWDFEHYLHENGLEKGSFIIEVKNLIKSIACNLTTFFRKKIIDY